MSLTLVLMSTTLYVISLSVEFYFCVLTIASQDFEGRVTWVARVYGDNDYDDHSHGTHCAGTIAGKTYGVAKKASLFAIKAFNAAGGGTT